MSEQKYILNEITELANEIGKKYANFRWENPTSKALNLCKISILIKNAHQRETDFLEDADAE